MAQGDEMKTTMRSNSYKVQAITFVVLTLVTIGRTTTTSITDKYNGVFQLPATSRDKRSLNIDDERLTPVHKRSVVDPSDDALSDDSLSDSLSDHIEQRPTRNFMRFGRRAPAMAFNCYPIFDRERLLEQLRPLVTATQHRIVGNAITMTSAYDNRKRFMRFGKRFMRFGRSDVPESRGSGGQLIYVTGSTDSGLEDYDFEGADSSKRFMRFGKRFMRFGRSRSSTEPSGHVTDAESPSGGDVGVSYPQKVADIVCFAGKDDVISSATSKPSSDKRFMRFGRKSDATMTESLAGGKTDNEAGTEPANDM